MRHPQWAQVSGPCASSKKRSPTGSGRRLFCMTRRASSTVAWSRREPVRSTGTPIHSSRPGASLTRRAFETFLTLVLPLHAIP